MASKGVNICIIQGNLGKAPQVKHGQSGMAIASFSVAVGYSKKIGDKKYEDATEWIPVKCFGQTAENVGKYLDKGSNVTVNGRFSTERWKDKNGDEKYFTCVIANDVIFGPKKAGEGGGGNREQRPASGGAWDGEGEGEGTPAATTPAGLDKFKSPVRLYLAADAPAEGGAWADDDLPF